MEKFLTFVIISISIIFEVLAIPVALFGDPLRAIALILVGYLILNYAPSNYPNLPRLWSQTLPNTPYNGFWMA